MRTGSAIVVLLGALLGLAGLAACGGVVETDRPSPAPGATRLAAVGDSITAADSPDLAAGSLGRESWVWHAVDERLAFVGGWAQWGATTEQMAAGVGALDADVLVVLAGTNDVGQGVPFAQTAANIEQIVARAGVDRVVLSAVPPIDAGPQNAVDLNAALEGLAREHGWTWVPQPGAIAEGDRFAPDMASDGLHPTEDGARVLGEAIGSAVRQAVPGSG